MMQATTQTTNAKQEIIKHAGTWIRAFQYSFLGKRRCRCACTECESRESKRGTRRSLQCTPLLLRHHTRDGTLDTSARKQTDTFTTITSTMRAREKNRQRKRAKQKKNKYQT